MKEAIYKTPDGKDFKIEYDEKAPCVWCGLPVESASMGGINLCPWCDCGNYRDGTKWTYKESMNQILIAQRAKQIYEKLKKDLIEQSKETAKLNLEICDEFKHTEPKN